MPPYAPIQTNKMQTITASAIQFFEQINSYLNKEERQVVQEAFSMARREHGDQRRKSGELFFTHPLTVAYYLSQYHLDAPALAAALLHDVAEDTHFSVNDIRGQFGEEVARLVDGVTKLKDVMAKGVLVEKGRKLTKQEQENATLAKLLGVMTNDVRVVIIKLFDRLHNMRTIKAMPPHKQRQKAHETLSVYAPLANRLGIWFLKNELESRSLEIIDNTAYRVLSDGLTQTGQEHQTASEQITAQIFDCLLSANIDVRDVLYSPENVYTVYRDISSAGKAFHNIDRTLRFEILLSDWPSCYVALGHLHHLWQPVPGNFDDYISMPRDNLYRSLHTMVVHENGQRIKLRIHTVMMDRVSEIGVLARWLYAGTPFWSAGVAKRVETFLQNISHNINVEPHDPSVGVRGVVEDVLQRQIRVYSPRGASKDLVRGATPIDFAYAIHTGLGDQCYSAYVNDSLHALNKPLADGDKVRIVKRPQTEPQRDWLDEDLGYVVTNYARSHIRRWFRRLPDHIATLEGRQLLQYELETLNLEDYSHDHIAELCQLENKELLYHQLGRAELLPTAVATLVLADNWNNEPIHELGDRVYTEDGESFTIRHAYGQKKLHLCGTCHPRPGDLIMGFIRMDGRVTVHNHTCATLRPERTSGRLIKLNWAEAQRQVRIVTMQVDVYDRPGLLYDITNLMHDEQINIYYIHTPPREEKGETRIILSLEMATPRDVIRILHQVRALANVYRVHCLPNQHIYEARYGKGYKPE